MVCHAALELRCDELAAAAASLLASGWRSGNKTVEVAVGRLYFASMQGSLPMACLARVMQIMLKSSKGAMQ